MSRPDDSILTPEQLANVRRHADRLLRDAGAIGRFPTPINTIMAAAKVTVVDNQVLDERFLRKLAAKFQDGLATLKSALSKVLGLFEANDRLVVLDKDVPAPRIPFVKLHEAGHGTLPHQSKMYALIHDCEKTLDPEITDLFEREANVFASEVFFQGDVFTEHARGHDFSVKAAMDLKKQFGASYYATFRRFAVTHDQACCLVVLEPVETGGDGSLMAKVRRVIPNVSFHRIHDTEKLTETVTTSHPLSPLVPWGQKQKMVRQRKFNLVDRNGERRACVGEAFYPGHQILVLMRDEGIAPALILPGSKAFSSTLQGLSDNE